MRSHPTLRAPPRCPAWAEESDVAGDLLWSATRGPISNLAWTRVERRRLQLAREEVVLHQRGVSEALRAHELTGGGEHRFVDIGRHHLAVRPDPLAQQSNPADRAAADIENARAATLADLVEETASGRLPHPQLEFSRSSSEGRSASRYSPEPSA